MTWKNAHYTITLLTCPNALEFLLAFIGDTSLKCFHAGSFFQIIHK